MIWMENDQMVSGIWMLGAQSMALLRRWGDDALLEEGIHPWGWALIDNKSLACLQFSLCFVLAVEGMSCQPSASAATLGHGCCHSHGEFQLSVTITKTNFLLNVPWSWCLITATGKHLMQWAPLWHFHECFWIPGVGILCMVSAINQYSSTYRYPVFPASLLKMMSLCGWRKGTQSLSLMTVDGYRGRKSEFFGSVGDRPCCRECPTPMQSKQ